MVFKSKGLTKAKCPILARAGVDYDGKTTMKQPDFWWVKAICFRACNHKPCIYDNSAYVSKRGKNQKVQARNELIFKLRNEGKAVKELETLFNVSTRTIRGAIRGNNED